MRITRRLCGQEREDCVEKRQIYARGLVVSLTGSTRTWVKGNGSIEDGTLPQTEHEDLIGLEEITEHTLQYFNSCPHSRRTSSNEQWIACRHLILLGISMEVELPHGADAAELDRMEARMIV